MSEKSSSLEVALIEPVGGHGGMNFYDFELARGLWCAGIGVTLYTCDETSAPTQAGFEVVHSFRGIYGKEHKLVRALRYVRGVFHAVKDARRRGARIAHFHFFHSTLLELLSVAIARLQGCRVVITAHDVRSFIGSGSGLVARLIFWLADAVIAHNAVSAEELEQVLKVDESKIHTISSGNYRSMARSAPERQEARRRLSLPKESTIFLFFGQIKKVKGLDLLLDSFPVVAEKFPEARLIIAGKVWKDDYESYAQMIRARGLEDSVVERIEFIPDELVGAYYAAADVVVLPYRKIYQSAVLLMAMSHCRAVLVSDLPGMTDIVTHAKSGWVFRQSDPQSLAEGLLGLAGDRDLRCRLALSGLQLMESSYRWETTGERTAAIYRKVAAN